MIIKNTWNGPTNLTALYLSLISPFGRWRSLMKETFSFTMTLVMADIVLTLP